MPYVVTKVNGKRFPFPDALFSENDIGRMRIGEDAYEVVNVVTRRRLVVGGKPKTKTRKRK